MVTEVALPSLSPAVGCNRCSVSRGGGFFFIEDAVGPLALMNAATAVSSWVASEPLTAERRRRIGVLRGG